MSNIQLDNRKQGKSNNSTIAPVLPNVENIDSVLLILMWLVKQLKLNFYGEKSVISVSYIPPISSKLMKYMLAVSRTFYDDVICMIFGDFNLPHLSGLIIFSLISFN